VVTLSEFLLAFFTAIHPLWISAFQAFRHTIQYMYGKLGGRSTQPRRNQPKPTCHTPSCASTRFLYLWHALSRIITGHHALPCQQFPESDTRIQIGGCQSTRQCQAHISRTSHAPPRAIAGLCLHLQHITRCCQPPCTYSFSRLQKKTWIPDRRLLIYSPVSSTCLEDA
jgi:hypothetical protein